MSYFYKKAEKNKLRGKDLKDLVDENTKVLVYYGDKLYGVNAQDYYVNVLKGLSKKSDQKIVFVSDNLNQLQNLDDYEEYVIDFVKNGLEVWHVKRENPGDLVLFISGITL